MRGAMDVIMWFFIVIVALAALKNAKGTSQIVQTTGQTAGGFGSSLLSQVPSS